MIISIISMIIAMCRAKLNSVSVLPFFVLVGRFLARLTWFTFYACMSAFSGGSLPLYDLRLRLAFIGRKVFCVLTALPFWTPWDQKWGKQS